MRGLLPWLIAAKTGMSQLAFVGNPSEESVDTLEHRTTSAGQLRRRCEVRSSPADHGRTLQRLADIGADTRPGKPLLASKPRREQPHLRRRLRRVAHRAHRGNPGPQPSGGAHHNADKLTPPPRTQVPELSSLHVTPSEILALFPDRLMQSWQRQPLQLIGSRVDEGFPQLFLCHRSHRSSMPTVGCCTCRHRDIRHI